MISVLVLVFSPIAYGNMSLNMAEDDHSAEDTLNSNASEVIMAKIIEKTDFTSSTPFKMSAKSKKNATGRKLTDNDKGNIYKILSKIKHVLITFVI